jgi:hypothetical protein
MGNCTGSPYATRRQFFPARRPKGPQNSADDLNSGYKPSKFDSLDQPLRQALDGLSKECRKAGKKSVLSSVPTFLPSLFQISHFEQDFVLRIQGIELALCEGFGDVEH